MTYDLLKELREKRKTYAEMVDFCCGDQLILNNSIIKYVDYNYSVYCGKDGTFYDDNGDETEEMTNDWRYYDIFQYYIISERAAERFEEYTNELVIYLEELDVYLLAVTHYGTAWSCVSANWKEDGE